MPHTCSVASVFCTFRLCLCRRGQSHERLQVARSHNRTRSLPPKNSRNKACDAGPVSCDLFNYQHGGSPSFKNHPERVMLHLKRLLTSYLSRDRRRTQ